MVAMPILALEKMHESEPSHVAARIFTRRDAGLGVANAVDAALGVKREHQPDGAQPEKCGDAEIQTAQVRQGQDRYLEPSLGPIREALQIGAISLDGRFARLPQPSQMGPPKTAPYRA